MFSETMIEDEIVIKEGPQYLLFFLQSHLFALRGVNIVEIVELPAITKVPWMQKSIKGVCNIRGSVVGVLDVARLVMDRDYILSKRSSLVIVKSEFEKSVQKVGLIVDEVFEVEVFESDVLQEVPSYGLPIDAHYIESIIRYKDDFIPILSLDSIVNIDSLSRRENYEK